MDVRNEMLKLVRNRRDGFSLQQPFYIDPDFYKLDMELIWYREWLFVGHNCEIPKPGGFFTVQVGDYPVVVVRGRDGEIRAFHNSCRHRGSRVCNTRARHLGAPRLPLSPMDLRPRRQARLRPPDGGEFRQGRFRAEAGRLRKCRRLHLHLPGRRMRRISSRSGR